MIHQTFLPELYERLVELLLAPTVIKEMLWIVIPLVAAMVLMEIYFGRYKLEKIGWNTAYGNSLVLLFISMDLIRFVVNNELIVSFSGALVVSLIIMGMFLAIFTFFHLFPENWAVGLDTKLPINITAYIIVVMVYSQAALTVLDITAALALAILIFIVAKTIWLMIPESFDV